MRQDRRVPQADLPVQHRLEDHRGVDDALHDRVGPALPDQLHGLAAGLNRIRLGDNLVWLQGNPVVMGNGADPALVADENRSGNAQLSGGVHSQQDLRVLSRSHRQNAVSPLLGGAVEGFQ